MVRPVVLEVAAGDFAFADGHRLTAISRLAATSNSSADFSIAAAAGFHWALK
jgi:hypothetical protein